MTTEPDARYASATKAAAADWARRQRFPPRDFEQLIDAVETDTLRYGRLITRRVRKTPYEKTEPFGGRKRPSPPPVAPGDVDPWAKGTEELEKESTYVRECATCGGSKKIACSTCRGCGRVACGECGGSGRVWGQRKEINCKSCSGKGTRACPTCSRGRIQCPTCEGAGKLRCWIAIRTSRHPHVQHWPIDAQIRSHPGIEEDSERAEQWPGASLVERVVSETRLAEPDIGPVAAEMAFATERARLEPELDPRLDRVELQTLTVFDAPVARVTFDFSGRAGSVNLLGARPVPTVLSNPAPFANRAGWIIASCVAFGLLASLATAVFALRDPFYTTSYAWLVFAALAMSAFGGALGVAGWRRRVRSDGERNAARKSDHAGPGIAACGLVLGLGLAGLHGPSLDAADAALESGDIAEAERHLEALGRAGRRDAEFGAARNRMLLLVIADAPNRAAVARLAENISKYDDVEALVQARRRLRRAWLQSRLDGHEYQRAEQELALLAAEGEDRDRVEELRKNTRARRLARATERLLAHDAEGSIAALAGVHLQDDPEASRLVVDAHRALAEKCAAPDLSCQLEHLGAAAAADSGSESKQAISHVKTHALQEIRKKLGAPGTLRRRMDAVQTAAAECAQLSKHLGADEEVARLVAAIEKRKATLLKPRRLIGQSIDDARILLGARLRGHARDGVSTVEVSEAASVDAFLIEKKKRVAGFYFVSTDRATSGISLESLQELAKLLLNRRVPAGALRREGKGIRHVRRTIGPDRAVFGWNDDQLVELMVGDISP